MITNALPSLALRRLGLAFTVEPFVTTLLWMLCVGNGRMHSLTLGAAVFVSARSLLPSLAYLGAILWRYWARLPANERGRAALIVLLDSIRCINSGVLVFAVMFAGSSGLWSTVYDVAWQLASLLPLLVGGSALVICQRFT